MKKIKHFVKTRKVSSILILLVVAGLAYYAYGKIAGTNSVTSYVTASAKVGTVSKTVTGTGQVSASSQLEITSKVSGNITYLNSSANGTEIKKGTLIASVDAHDAQIALESARLSYQKLVKPADASTLLSAQNSLNDAIQTNAKSYEDALSSMSSTFLDVPTVMNGLNNLLYGSSGYLRIENVRSIGQTAVDYQIKASQSYDKAKALYESIQTKYQAFSQSNSTSTIESFASQTYDFIKSVSEALKNTQSALDFVRLQRADTSGDSSAGSLASWTTTINSDSASLLSVKNSMTSSRLSVEQKKADLVSVQEGADEFDIASSQLNLQQKQYDYQNYFIRAPFDGLLAKLSVKSTDVVNSGTAIATMVSRQKIATISLNEVDAVNVKVGQKATITLDAIEGLTIEATVVSVDQVGTVSQGVVSYNTEVSFDTQDDRVKSGMSVSVSIITDSHENVLTVPSSAIKSQGKMNYVEVLNSPSGTPMRKIVETGLNDDTMTEIISGLNEGDKVVTKTISSTSKTTTTATQPTIFGTGNRTGGTNIRIPRN